MFRKILASFVAVSLMLGSLSGCKKGGETEPTEVAVATTDIASNAETETENNTPVQTGIVDMTDPTPIGNYGKIYYAPVDEKHIAEEDSVKFVDNEILAVAKDGVTEEHVKSVADKYNCEIVGEIEVTGDYQLRLSEVKTKAELENTVKSMEAENAIESASLNYVTEMSPADVEEHAGYYYGEKWQGDLQNYEDVAGLSWGIEAINTMGAWDELKSHEKQVNPVRVGVIDIAFDSNHDDLGFAEVFYDVGKNGVVENPDLNPNHGTHVAGIFAAKTGDKTGICGVYPYGDKNLYGVGYGASSAHPENGSYYESMMATKISLAELIVRNVKVINVSEGFNFYKDDKYQINKLGGTKTDYDRLKAWWEDPNNFTSYNRQANELGAFLERMIQKGYDFVIISSAGNDSNDSIGHLDARKASWLNLISERDCPNAFNRIVVVGAVDMKLNVTGYSNGGSRVDIYAPGGSYMTITEIVGGPTIPIDGLESYVLLGIFSTFPQNEYGEMEGTSMAAPHVAGVAAMVWSANNSLKGEEVKKIITGSISTRCTSCSMIDAQKAVKKAFKSEGSGDPINPECGSVNCYVVDRFNANHKIKNAKITLKNADTGEKYDTETDSEGHFEIMVPEGKYTLSVKADGYGDYEWPDGNDYQNPIVIEKEQVNYLADSVRADGKIRMNKIEDLQVYAVDKDTNLPITNKEISITFSNSKCLNPRQRLRDEDGSVTFKTIAGSGEGKVKTEVTLHIDGYKDYYIAEYMILDQNVDSQELRVLFEKDETYLTPGTKPSDEIITVIKDGDTIIFGHYEQDNNTENGKEPIEWDILDENANGKLLISRYVLDAVPFNNEYATDVTWETCSLREWLNKDFLNEAFTKGEQALIPKAHLKNSGIEMPGGNDTDDQVFCLSLEEAAKYYKFTYDKYAYFGFKKELITLPTEYAKAHGMQTFNAKDCIDEPYGDEYWLDGYAPKGYQASIADLAGTYWWLRTMGWDCDACAVFPNGLAGAHYESGVSAENYGVRPVLWISNEAIKGETETEPNSPESYDGDGVAINAENFPDERFRMLLQDDYDEDGNWVFSKEELEEIKRVDVFEENISSLQGIELLYNLQRLQCGKNKLTRLDVSHNTKLKYLACSNNPLSGLDVSHNTALEELYYSETGLKEVDISNNTNLKVLYCSDNDMTRLDVSHNPALEALGCKGNQLTSLDISKNANLEKLYCSSNLLTKLDVSHNPKLKQLHCQVNELQTLDVSHNPLLESIECFYDQLTELDVSHNPVLKYLDCGSNQLKSLDVSHNPALIHLCCGSNQLTSLDVNCNEELKMLQCYANQISNLDLSNNKQLTDLSIDKKTSYTGLIPNVDIELIDRSNGYNVTRIKSE